MELKKYKLRELIEIKNGKEHKHLMEGEYPVYGSGGIMRYVNEYIYNEPSVLLPRKGTLNNIQYSNTPFWTVDTLYYTKVKTNIVNPYYLYRYLKLLDLSNLDTGTGVPSMTFDSYYNIEVLLPSIEEQNKKSKILQLLDEKIELNRKINDNLEAMAKQLYDYWFVQFDFPNEEGKPYKSSGGKMVWNEKLKREIPDRWEIKKLKEVLQHINTGLNPRDNFVFGGNIKYITVKNLTTNNYIDFSKCDTIDKEAHKKVHKRSRISSGDILYASICPLGRTYLITEEPIDWDINESVFSIRPNHNEITSEYLNMLLKDEYYIATLSNSSTGSIFLGIRIKQLEETHILLPQKDIQNIFSQKIKNIIQLQVNHFKQIESLTKQRDELLPLLMNGQVSVN